MVTELPRTLLRLEGLSLLVIALVAFGQLAGSWVLFVVLLLVPDVGMLGYLRSPVLGAVTYDLFHTLAGPLLLGLSGFVTGWSAAFPLAMIWLAHIGMDRALGYGLKYGSGFQHTHLGLIGPGKHAPKERHPSG